MINNTSRNLQPHLVAAADSRSVLDGYNKEESSSVAIIEWDSHWRVRSWPRKAQAIFGWREKDMLGQFAGDFIADEDRLRFQEVAIARETKRADSDHCCGPIIFRCRTESGATVECEWHLIYLRSPSGRFEGTVSCVSDPNETLMIAKNMKSALIRAQNLLNNMGDGFFRLDREWKFLELNRQAEEIIGRTGSQLIGKIFWEAFPSTLGTEVEVYYREAMDLRRPVAFDMAASVVGRWFETKIIPEEETLTVFFRDVSERKEREKALIESEKKFEVLVDILPHFIWVLDINGYPEFVNGSWYSYRQQSKDFTPSVDQFWAAVHPDARELAIKCWQEALKNQQGFLRELPIQRFDGVYHCFLVRGVPQQDHNGEIVQWLLSCTDIEEQKQLNKDLIESKARFEVALDVAKMGAWEMDFTTREIVRSQGHDLLFGAAETFKVWNYETFLNAIHPDDRGLLKSKFEETQTERKAGFKAEFRVIWPDNSVHWISSCARVTYDIDTETPVKAMGAVIDITDVKEFEIDLQKAVQMRDDFLSVASHELRTPLTSLKLQTQLLIEMVSERGFGSISEEKLNRYLQLTDRQVGTLTNLIDDLFDVTRISSGRLELNVESVNLEDMIRRVVRQMENNAKVAHTLVEMDLEKIPLGQWDSHRLEQVFVNLYSNALKYGQGRAVHVSLSKRNDRWARLSVTDHGLGISAENTARIFEKFERAVGHRQISGLGLGLYIAKEIVEAHRGRLWVESELGKGSTFIVELPFTHNSN